MGPPLWAFYGPTRNLHLLWEKRFKEWNDFLARAGGYNKYGEPKYRIVWGWQFPDCYGIGGDEGIEFFRMERWVPETEFDEDEWHAKEKGLTLLSPKYQMKPFPRHGEYLEIETCSFERRTPDGKVEVCFLEPRASWYEWRLSRDIQRLARTRDEIREEIAEDNAMKKTLARRANKKILDDAGVSEVAEDEVRLLHRNPTLRKDPDLMLSPAMEKKRTRHRIANTL